jgi:hypothetical protein
MFKNPKSAGRYPAHLYSLVNRYWLLSAVTLVLLLFIRRPIAAQNAEVPGVVVTGEAVATPTPHDNFREMQSAFHLHARHNGSRRCDVRLHPDCV